MLIRGRRFFEGGAYLISLLQQLEGSERGRLVLSNRQSLQPSRWTEELEDFEERTEWKSVEIYSRSELKNITIDESTFPLLA